MRPIWQKRGDCIVCRKPMHPYFDKGHTNCISCRDRRINNWS